SGVSGKHYHRTLDIFDTSMIINFAEHVMRQKKKIKMAILFPTEETMSNSSLAHYLALAKKEFGTEDSAYCFDEDGIQHEKLFKMLREAEEADEPILVLGASYSYVHLFEDLEKQKQTFNLPDGSKI